MGKPMAGKDGIIKFTQQAAGYIDSWSLSVNRGTAEVSQLGNGWKDYIGTVNDWSGSASGTLDYGDKAQKALVDAFISGNAEAVELSLHCGEGIDLGGSVIVTSVSVNAEHGGKVSVSFNFQGTGALKNTAVVL